MNLLEMEGERSLQIFCTEHVCEAMSIIFMMTITMMMMMTSTTMTAMNLCMNKNFNKPMRLFEDKFSWAFD